MSGLDLVVLLVIAFVVVKALLAGFMRTLFSLGAWFSAFFVGKWGAWLIAPMIPVGGDHPEVRYFVAFAVVFVAVLIAMAVLGHTLALAMRALGLGALDSVLGGVLGALKSLVILVGLTLAAGLTALPRTELWQTARTTPALERMAHAALPLVPAELAKHVRFDRE